MVERFLQYSLEHQKAIRVLWESNMTMQNITVVALGENSFSYISSKQKAPREAPLTAVLSASYARGDDGDTLQYAVKEQIIYGKMQSLTS